MDAYVIIDLGSCIVHRKFNGDFILPNLRPTIVHYDQDQAENELVRLSKAHPGIEFVLFKAIAKTKHCMPPHDSECVIDDELPF